LSLDKRRATSPPDDCISCHMPKRTVTTITHAALTDHTIPINPSPSAQNPSQQAKSTELLHLTAPFGERESLQSVPPFVLFQAYNDLVRDGHKEFQEKKNDLLNQVARTKPSDPIVLRALAERSFFQDSPEGLRKAITYMEQIPRTSANVDDSLFLAELYAREKHNQQAVAVLEKARIADPYFRELYELLAAQYLELGKYGIALAVLQKGLELFPDDAKLRVLDRNARAVTLDGVSP
jgi:tetratricopeptide (TPR) repeat protein